MNNYVTEYQRRRSALIDGHAYEPESESDACGVGMIAALDVKPNRKVVDMAIAALKAVWHRGAVDADGKTGDGAGIRLDIPQELFRKYIQQTGHENSDDNLCVGMLFLPRENMGAQDQARLIVETEIIRYGFYIYGWRQAPIDTSCLGEKANATRPEIEQIIFVDQQNRSPEALERTLYLVRRRIEKRAQDNAISDLYVCSLSSRDIVYKGMFLAEDIDKFYLDLNDPSYTSKFAIFHQRYSTNTFPEWKLAQPFRMLAHNGEINTLKGNRNWMKSHEIKMTSDCFGEDEVYTRPVIQHGSSDSAALDQVFELIVRAGRTAPMAKALLLPEAWSKRTTAMPPKWRALFEYCNAVMEPWDGPAAIAATDGAWLVAGLDRNGLRPMRYAVTTDNILAVGSEAGMCPIAEDMVSRRGSIDPGRMLAVNLDDGEFLDDEAVLDRLSGRYPYEDWLKNIVELDTEIGPGPEERLFDGGDLRRRQLSAAYTNEVLDMILRPMGEDSKEALGSMGDDTPLAVLSDRYRPLSHFFRQNFSQVTNPPIDPLRESGVMSLKTRFKNLGNILVTNDTQTDVFVLESPVLTNGMFDRLKGYLDQKIIEIDCTYDFSSAKGDGSALKAAIETIKEQALRGVADGAGHVFLTDEHQGRGRIAIPMILATSAIHQHLVQEGQRSNCSLTVRSAECVEPHYMAVLIGVGATAVNPYLAFDCLGAAIEDDTTDINSVSEGAFNLKTAFEAGLLKIISKMGISVISSYRGGCNFEALGLSRTLVNEYFPGMTSRISGIGLAGIEVQTIAMHSYAWEGDEHVLPIGGFYRYRRTSEHHILEADVVRELQTAVRDNDAAAFDRYKTALDSQPPSQIRCLMDCDPLGPSVPLVNVESETSIQKRFVTPGMSLGALSEEAHGVLNIAMNRIGAKSVSGEGGEVPERYTPRPNGDNENSAIKQIASGRFGVTAEYLNQCREIEIKVAQGAKPGEGGQLPGFKVTEFIARMRHATPGVTLISPPPHHDIYSIEDLAQLIYDLKQINPEARVCVKLVSAAGIGAIAAGVAKAKADTILISGNVGGTGASPQTSIKFAGSPWELGLSEAHQVLTLNNLRENVTLRTDGGIRTGRDVVIAAMLGAEEYGIGTASLVALGCLMVRQCHSNTCPVGICTQDEKLRGFFTGKPEHVTALMRFIAEDVRKILASIGAKSLDEVVGRTDLLRQVSRGAAHLDDLDLNPLLVNVDGGQMPSRSTRTGRTPIGDTLDQRVMPDIQPFLEVSEKMEISASIKNTDRAIGARISSHIVRRHDTAKLEPDHLTLKLRGSAGQSLGVFSAYGLKIVVDGEANDYVGKGLSGATLVVRPIKAKADSDAIIGNTCLYGATSGYLFAAGKAGSRFAVRNSGASAVIEGCSANGCEYMTGGVVVVMGSVGHNFGAGMTGGRAYVFGGDDELTHHANKESVLWRALSGEDEERECRDLIERHFKETKSARAEILLAGWEKSRQKIRIVEPIGTASNKELFIAAKTA